MSYKLTLLMTDGHVNKVLNRFDLVAESEIQLQLVRLILL